MPDKNTESPKRTARIEIGIVAVSHDAERTIAFAKSKAADWGFEPGWEPGIEEAVREIVICNQSAPLDAGVEIVNSSQRLVED